MATAAPSEIVKDILLPVLEYLKDVEVPEKLQPYIESLKVQCERHVSMPEYEQLDHLDNRTLTGVRKTQELLLRQDNVDVLFVVVDGVKDDEEDEVAKDENEGDEENVEAEVFERDEENVEENVEEEEENVEEQEDIEEHENVEEQEDAEEEENVEEQENLGGEETEGEGINEEDAEQSNSAEEEDEDEQTCTNRLHFIYDAIFGKKPPKIIASVSTGLVRRRQPPVSIRTYCQVSRPGSEDSYSGDQDGTELRSEFHKMDSGHYKLKEFVNALVQTARDNKTAERIEANDSPFKDVRANSNSNIAEGISYGIDSILASNSPVRPMEEGSSGESSQSVQYIGTTAAPPTAAKNVNLGKPHFLSNLQVKHSPTAAKNVSQGKPHFLSHLQVASPVKSEETSISNFEPLDTSTPNFDCLQPHINRDSVIYKTSESKDVSEISENELLIAPTTQASKDTSVSIRDSESKQNNITSAPILLNQLSVNEDPIIFTQENSSSLVQTPQNVTPAATSLNQPSTSQQQNNLQNLVSMFFNQPQMPSQQITVSQNLQNVTSTPMAVNESTGSVQAQAEESINDSAPATSNPQYNSPSSLYLQSAALGLAQHRINMANNYRPCFSNYFPAYPQLFNNASAFLNHPPTNADLLPYFDDQAYSFFPRLANEPDCYQNPLDFSTPNFLRMPLGYNFPPRMMVSPNLSEDSTFSFNLTPPHFPNVPSDHESQPGPSNRSEFEYLPSPNCRQPPQSKSRGNATTNPTPAEESNSNNQACAMEIQSPDSVTNNDSIEEPGTSGQTNSPVNVPINEIATSIEQPGSSSPTNSNDLLVPTKKRLRSSVTPESIISQNHDNEPDSNQQEPEQGPSKKARNSKKSRGGKKRKKSSHKKKSKRVTQPSPPENSPPTSNESTSTSQPDTPRTSIRLSLPISILHSETLRHLLRNTQDPPNPSDD